MNKASFQIVVCPTYQTLNLIMEASNPIKKIIPRLIIGTLLVCGAIYGYNTWQHSKLYETTDNAQVETSTAPVLARVAGYVQSLAVADYGTVTSGKQLISIDPAEYQLAVTQAEADYKQSLADLAQAKAQLGIVGADVNVANVSLSNSTLTTKASQANVEVAQIRLEKAKKDMEREQKLFADNANTQRQLDDASANYEVAKKMLDAAVEQVNAVKGGSSTATAQIGKAKTQTNLVNAQIQRAEAVVNVKKAMIDQAKLRLSYTKVTAPIAGKIGKKNVEVGQYIQPGQNLMTIVNDSMYWVIANFKETQIGRMKVGQPVEIKLDAYPDAPIKGKIASLSEATGAKFSLLPPDNASGNFVKLTQRVPVKIELENLNQYKEVLRAGLSVDVSVKVE
jgi:membrane fusion protein, multidrug efflux system